MWKGLANFFSGQAEVSEKLQEVERHRRELADLNTLTEAFDYDTVVAAPGPSHADTNLVELSVAKGESFAEKESLVSLLRRFMRVKAEHWLNIR
jgi:hypothetical protein